MRILIICDKWGALGGTEQTVFDYIDFLKRKGHHCCLIYAKKTGKLLSTSSFDKMQYYEIPCLSKFVSSEDAEYEKALRQIIANENPDVIFFRDVMNLRLLKVLINYRRIVAMAHDYKLLCLRDNKIFYLSKNICSRRLGISCLMHGCFLKKKAGTFKSGLKYNSIAKLRQVTNLYRRIGHILVTSRYMKNIFIQYGFSHHQIEIVGHFVKLPIYKYATPNESSNILFLGRIDRYKGVEFFACCGQASDSIPLYYCW